MAASLATYKQLRHVVFVDAIPRLPSGKVLRRTLRDEWTPVLLGIEPGGPDGRPPLPRAGRRCADSAARIVDRLGPGTVRGLDDAERAGRLDAAVAASGWRELRVPVDGRSPLASGVEVAIVAEELGRGLADAPFLGPTLAAELRRLAGCTGGR